MRSDEILDEEELNQLLSAVGEIEPSAQLTRRVAEVPVRAVAKAPPGWASWWRPMLSFIACAAAGVVVGWVSPGDLLEDELGASLYEREQEAEIDELSASELAFSDHLLEGWQ